MKRKKSTARAENIRKNPQKERIKALVVTLICAAVILTALFFTVFGFRYVIKDDGTWSLSGYRGFSNELEIPEKHLWQDVTIISDYTFFQDKDIERVTISGRIRTYGRYAFFGCSSLESLYLPDGAVEIMEFCFAECSSLKEIRIPASVSRISANAFNGCDTELVIVAERGSYAHSYAIEHEIMYSLEA